MRIWNSEEVESQVDLQIFDFCSMEISSPRMSLHSCGNGERIGCLG